MEQYTVTLATYYWIEELHPEYSETECFMYLLNAQYELGWEYVGTDQLTKGKVYIWKAIH